ncbi:hypothetical protein ACLBWZ_13155 [Brucellaceae bacterium C25G]
MDSVRFNKADTLQYIEEMLRNMRVMAKTTDNVTLVYLLDMAIKESRGQLEAKQNTDIQSFNIALDLRH